MRTGKTLLKLIAVSILVALPIAWAMSSARVSAQNSCPQKSTHFGMLGLVQGQTVRINAVYIPPDPCRGQIPPDPCRVEMVFHDSDGNVVTNRDGNPFDSTISLAAGKSAFLDLDANSIGTGGGRLGIAPCIKVSCASNNPSIVDNVVPTVEVFDSSTLQTSFVVAAPGSK